MEIETLRELQKTLRTVEVSNVDCMKDFSEGFNAGIRHVKRQLDLMIDARIEVARIVGEPVVSKMVQATPTPTPTPKVELKPKAEAQVETTPKATSTEKLEPGELPPGWRFLEVGEFLQDGDVLNSTGFGVDTGGRDDMRCTAKRTWRRKK